MSADFSQRLNYLTLIQYSACLGKNKPAVKLSEFHFMLFAEGMCERRQLVSFTVARLVVSASVGLFN